MKKLSNLKLCMKMLVCFMAVLIVQQSRVEASAISFTDVPTNHFAKEPIQWATAQGIVNGYGNGKFGPDDQVTEEQFTKMVSSYFQLPAVNQTLTKHSNNNSFFNSYYESLAAYEVPLNGYFSEIVRSQPVTRGVVAQILSSLAGSGGDLTTSIHFLVSNKISNGMYPQYEQTDLYQFFGVKQTLTRGQAVTFLSNLNKQGINKPSEASKNHAQNVAPLPLNERAKNGQNKVESSLVKMPEAVQYLWTSKPFSWGSTFQRIEATPEGYFVSLYALDFRDTMTHYFVYDKNGKQIVNKNDAKKAPGATFVSYENGQVILSSDAKNYYYNQSGQLVKTTNITKCCRGINYELLPYSNSASLAEIEIPNQGKRQFILQSRPVSSISGVLNVPNGYTAISYHEPLKDPYNSSGLFVAVFDRTGKLVADYSLTGRFGEQYDLISYLDGNGNVYAWKKDFYTGSHGGYVSKVSIEKFNLNGQPVARSVLNNVNELNVSPYNSAYFAIQNFFTTNENRSSDYDFFHAYQYK